MISEIPKKYELTLGYSWKSKIDQGICGHLFEMIEYYTILKKYFSVCMMVCENMPWNKIESTIRDKYDFEEDEIRNIRDNLIFLDRPRIVKGNALLLLDGNLTGIKDRVLHFNKLMIFPCRDLKFQTIDNVIALQDDRIYGKGRNTINYIKKVLLDRYRDIGPSEKNNLVYATSNPRWLSKHFYEELEERFDGDFLLLSDKKVEGLSDRFKQEDMPVKNLFERFDRYIYTPTMTQKDCSPRFPVECKFYNKDIEYFKIGYLDRDLGLRYRRHDIENNFESLYLEENDEIIDIIRKILYGN